MKELNLILHCGGVSADRKQLAEMRTPLATDSWQPIPHHELVESVGETLTRSGLTIVNEAHGLARDGARYFGMMQVMNGHNPDDYGLVVGVRNSHDKSFPASLCLGAGVFVCDNLSFSGEVTLARKHTRHILRDLPGLVERGVGLLGDHRRHQDLRIEAYKGKELTDSQAHDVIINALDARVIGSTAIPNILKEWRSPKHDEFSARTVWSLFNGFTEIGKGNAMRSLVNTQKLHGLCDSVCGLTS